MAVANKKLPFTMQDVLKDAWKSNTTNASTNRSGSGHSYSGTTSAGTNTNYARAVQNNQQQAINKAVANQNAQAGQTQGKVNAINTILTGALSSVTPVKKALDTPSGGGGGGGGGSVGGGSYAPVGSGFQASESYIKALEYTNSLLEKLSSGRTSYTDKINQALSDIENFGKFSYDMNKDALFQNALASAMKSGQMAMQDTIGQASALTGGYGSSYAVSAGNQAYNQMLEGAYDQLPDYYQIAMDAYNQELNGLYNKATMYGDLDKTEYDRLVTAYNANRQNTDSIYDREYNEFWNNKNFEEQQRQFSAEMGYKNAKLAQDQANWEKEYALSVEQAKKKDSSKKDIKDIANVITQSANQHGLGSDSPTMDLLTMYANQGYDLDEMLTYLQNVMDKPAYTLGADNQYYDQWGNLNKETPAFTFKEKDKSNSKNDKYEDQFGNEYLRGWLKSRGFSVK